MLMNSPYFNAEEWLLGSEDRAGLNGGHLDSHRDGLMNSLKDIEPADKGSKDIGFWQRISDLIRHSHVNRDFPGTYIDFVELDRLESAQRVLIIEVYISYRTFLCVIIYHVKIYLQLSSKFIGRFSQFFSNKYLRKLNVCAYPEPTINVRVVLYEYWQMNNKYFLSFTLTLWAPKVNVGSINSHLWPRPKGAGDKVVKSRRRSCVLIQLGRDLYPLGPRKTRLTVDGRVRVLELIGNYPLKAEVAQLIAVKIGNIPL